MDYSASIVCYVYKSNSRLSLSSVETAINAISQLILAQPKPNDKRVNILSGGNHIKQYLYETLDGSFMSIYPDITIFTSYKDKSNIRFLVSNLGDLDFEVYISGSYNQTSEIWAMVEDKKYAITDSPSIALYLLDAYKVNINTCDSPKVLRMVKDMRIN